MTGDSKIVIETKQLKKVYPGTKEEALKGINLSVFEGEFFGLLGPNSAGKTTLISIFCGLLKISHGEVFVNNINVNRHPGKIKKLIGLIPQEIALYPSLTIKENLRYFGQLHGIYGKELNNRIDESLSIVRLTGHSDKLVSKCSNGIKRRANLIAGLIHKPAIVFLDEPTLGVDAQSRNLIFEYLKQLNNTKTTIIYTTHYMEEVENLCSRIVIIDNGKIIEHGRPDELIRKHNDCINFGQVFLKLTGKELRD
ncbi:MAG: ABC transporter ATP-binding protein [Bacteroidota bacterium]